MGAVGEGAVGLACRSSLAGAAEGGLGIGVKKTGSSSLAALAACEVWRGRAPAPFSSSSARKIRDKRIVSNGHLSILRRWMK